MSKPTLFEFVARLKSAGIYFTMNSVRDDMLMVEVAVPGQRWEIEFCSDGSIEIEVFKSDGKIHDEAKLELLFREFSD